MRKTGIINYITRILLAVLVAAAAAFNSVPAAVKAAPNPVDLELDAAGYTPIIANNIEPGDSGTKTVELRNVGTKNGLVYIWFSDIIRGEGVNPEAETGDTSGEGELDEYFLMDIDVPGLSSNLNFPAPIKNFPTSATEQRYINVIPLKAGQTKTLDWYWELPADTGNDVQGDELSFTINYLLREVEITDVSSNVTPGGQFINDTIILSEKQSGKIRIAANTTGKTADNQTPTEIWFLEKDNIPPSPSGGRTLAGQYFDAGPDGMTFDQPLTITLTYNPEDIPDGVSESELFIALWDNTAQDWIPLPDCVIDTQTKTISTLISHFSRYTVLAPEPPPPAPGPPVTIVDTTPVIEETQEEETRVLEVSLLEEEEAVEISEDGILRETVTVSSSDGMFTLELPEGTRITGPGGVPLSRIELVVEETDLPLPENTVLLTPGYRLVGYDQQGEIIDIEFSPEVRLTIRYDTKQLPENAFLPYIAGYSDEEGLVRQESPINYPVSLGRVDALINRNLLFVVVVEVAPPPPPLPAHFTASNLTITPPVAFEGESVQIAVTIINDGSENGTTELYLIIDGVVRAIQEVTLGGNSRETLTFEISNLAAGIHQIKIAGLTETVRIEQVVIEPLGAGVNWLVLDLSVAAAVIIGLLVWLFYMRRARRREAGQ